VLQAIVAFSFEIYKIMSVLFYRRRRSLPLR